MKREGGSGNAKKGVKRINKSETAGDLVRMVDDGTEERGKTSFMDLNDDCLILIFELLDFPTQLKLRLNNRLDWIHQFRVKKSFAELNLDIYSRSWELQLNDGPLCKIHDYIQLEKGLSRLANNTSIRRISIGLHSNMNRRRNACLIKEISNFETDFLVVWDAIEEGGCHVPRVDRSTLLTLAKNVRAVLFDINCPSLSAQDLCELRKFMIESDDCKLKHFDVNVDDETKMSFPSACFGVSVKEVTEPLRGKIYRASDESVKLYLEDRELDGDLHHVEGNFLTEINFLFLTFKKETHGAVDLQVDNKPRVQFNHLYLIE